jgi:hypothetical protein
MAKRMGNDQKVRIVATNQDSKSANAIRESPWNVVHEYDANQGQKALDSHCQALPNEQRWLLCALGRRSQNRFNDVLHQPIAGDKKIEM